MPEIRALADASRRASFREAVRARPAPRDTLLTLGQAAKYLHMTTRWLRRQADEHRVPFLTAPGRGTSRHWRYFRQVDLDRVLVETPACE